MKPGIAWPARQLWGLGSASTILIATTHPLLVLVVRVRLMGNSASGGRDVRMKCRQSASTWRLSSTTGATCMGSASVQPLLMDWPMPRLKSWFSGQQGRRTEDTGLGQTSLSQPNTRRGACPIPCHPRLQRDCKSASTRLSGCQAARLPSSASGVDKRAAGATAQRFVMEPFPQGNLRLQASNVFFAWRKSPGSAILRLQRPLWHNRTVLPRQNLPDTD